MPSPPSPIARRRALSEQFRQRGKIQRMPLDACRFEHARHLVRFCGFTATAARAEAVATFQA